MSPEAAFVYTPDILKYNFGPYHPFRSERSAWTQEAVAAELTQAVDIIEPVPATPEELAWFHTEEYVAALVSEDRMRLAEFGIGTGDNPYFKDIFAASAAVAGCTLTAARLLVEEKYRVAFAFPGGLHHAHPAYAYGFCLVNDLALAIHCFLQEKENARVFYLDVDAHFGDGVVYGFYEEPRVFTFSVHESGRFLFPGTGFLDEKGRGEALGTKFNLPLFPRSGEDIFLKVVNEFVLPLLEAIMPTYIVLQLGTDAYRSDPLTHLAYSPYCYLYLLRKLRTFLDAHPVRLLVTGGGGYVPWFAAAVWYTATAVLSGSKAAELPSYPERYFPDFPRKFSYSSFSSLLVPAYQEEWQALYEKALGYRDEIIRRFTD